MSKAWLGVTAAVVIALSVSSAAQEPSGPLTIARQGSFFVGGRELRSEALSTRPAWPTSGTVTVDQVYVRYQIPVSARGVSLVLVHGCCLTGKTWETTPDGRMGWDEYLVRRGYPVYVIDQASRGRSASDATAIASVTLGKTPTDRLPSTIWASREAAWDVFRFGPEYSKTYPGLRFPVASLTEFWKQMVPDWNTSLPTPNPSVVALSELAIRLGRTVLVSHSQSGIYPFQVVDLNSQGIAAIVSIEPAACPDVSAAKGYTSVPALVLWGDYVESSPRWGPRLKACRDFGEAVNRLGGSVSQLVLPDIGIRGNSHMLMQDTNNLEVADRVLAWLRSRVEGEGRN
jgi:pimeloyl-ACP methyl ester carboxylesterase